MAHAHHGRSKGTIAAFRKDIQVYLDGVKEHAQSALEEALRAEEERVKAEAMRASGVEPLVRRYADGKFVSEGEAGDRVRLPTGTKGVVLDWSYLREVATQTHRLLVSRAPKISGEYMEKIIIFANGRRVRSLRQIPFDAEVLIVPTADYARRLEIGKKKNGRPFVSQVEYQMVERLTRAVVATKYRNLADVSFNYTDIDNPYKLRGSMIGSRYKDVNGKMRKRMAWADRRAGEPVRYPAIVIRRKG